MIGASDFFKLLRVNNWVKNLFIFLPLFFSAELFDTDKLLHTSLIFMAFCLATSFIYIINDITDREFDKIHPTKRFRPIAAGKVSINTARFFAFLLLGSSLLALFFISKLSLLFTIVYVLINLLYSFSLKHMPILDFMTISVGFVIRILIGGYANDIPLSHWILIMVFLLSIFIAISKRRDDILQYQEEDRINRKVVQKYNLEFIDKVIGIISSVLIVSYLLYITSEEVIQEYNLELLLLTFVFVVIGVIRYNYITYLFKKSGSPLKILFKDRFMQINLFLWLVTFFVMIYIKSS